MEANDRYGLGLVHRVVRVFKDVTDTLSPANDHCRGGCHGTTRHSLAVWVVPFYSLWGQQVWNGVVGIPVQGVAVIVHSNRDADMCRWLMG